MVVLDFHRLTINHSFRRLKMYQELSSLFYTLNESQLKALRFVSVRTLLRRWRQKSNPVSFIGKQPAKVSENRSQGFLMSLGFTSPLGLPNLADKYLKIKPSTNAPNFGRSIFSGSITISGRVKLARLKSSRFSFFLWFRWA